MINNKELLKYTKEIPEIKEQLKELAFIRNEIKKHQRRLKSLNIKYDFLYNIIKIGSTGVLLEESLRKYFLAIGYKNVVHTGKDNKKADIEIRYGNKVILIECKGIIRPTPSEAEVLQISKFKHRINEPGKRIFGIFIVNHDNKKIFRTRNKNPFDDQKNEDAKSGEYGLITTVDLFDYFIDFKKNKLSFAKLNKILCEYGLIKY